MKKILILATAFYMAESAHISAATISAVPTTTALPTTVVTTTAAASPTVVLPVTTTTATVPAVIAPTVVVPTPPTPTPNPGHDYVNTVIEQVGKALLPDYNVFSAAVAAYIIPTIPNVDAATVCLEQTSNGRIYRLHSKSPSSNGIVTNTGDLAVFNAEFFAKNKGDDINFSTPDSSNPGSYKTFVGKVIAKLGNTICFARYRLS